MLSDRRTRQLRIKRTNRQGRRMRFCMNLITRGKFEHCLKTEETTPLEPKTKECKSYAPGVGLVKDGGMVLKVFEFNRE